MRVPSRKIREKILTKRAVMALAAATLSFAVAMPINLFGKKSKTAQQEETVDIFELALDENLYTPKLGKAADAIADFQLETARSLKKEKYNVELMRDGEVIVVTIYANQLFNPNDTTLSDVGDIVLRPFVKYLDTPGLYKMILVMHSDNTGSAQYTGQISRSRVDAVYDWFERVTGSRYVVPYALGSVEPLYPNNSVENRRKNRRLEIYLVPGYEMIDRARNGKITLK